VIKNNYFIDNKSLNVIYFVVEIWDRDLQLSPIEQSQLVLGCCDVIVAGGVYRGISGEMG